MPRATNAPASRQRRRRILRQARGFRGARHRLYRQATEAVDRGMRLATEHRKLKKREYRGLWTVRISAACRQHGMQYSRFISGLTKLQVKLNRKMLSEIAIHDPEGFSGIVKMAQAAIA